MIYLTNCCVGVKQQSLVTDYIHTLFIFIYNRLVILTFFLRKKKPAENKVLQTMHTFIFRQEKNTRLI